MNNIKLVIKSLSKRKLSVLFVSLQVVTSILFLISIACTFQKIFYFDITVHKNIKPNASQIIHVKINADSATPEKYFSFRGQILKQSGIDSMGYFNTNNTVIFSTLANSPELKKMKSEQKDILGIPEEFSAVKIEKGLQELKSLQIVEGRNFENTDFSSDNLIVPILVGYNFIKYNVVNIGDELYDSNNKKKYKVIGALKERSTWFMSSLSDGVLEYLDNKIVIASNDGDYFPFIQGMMKSSYYCIVKSSKTVPKIMTNMIEIANKEGLSVEVRTISDELKKYQQEIINENIKWLIFSLFFILMTSLCIASVMMSSLVSRLKEIGIRIAVGYSINQIQKLFITEVLFIIIMSSLLASIFAVCTINLSSSLLSDLAPDGYYVSFPIIVGVLGISLLMSLPPVTAIVYRLKRLQPRELIGGKE